MKTYKYFKVFSDERFKAFSIEDAKSLMPKDIIGNGIMKRTIHVEEEDNLTQFIKFLDMRNLLDFFIDNKIFYYSLDEIREYINYLWIDRDIETLVHMGVIKLRDDGKYAINIDSEIAKTLIKLDNLVTEEMNEHGSG